MKRNRPGRYALSIAGAAGVAFLIGLLVQSLLGGGVPFVWVAVIDVAVGVVCGVAAVLLLRPWYAAPRPSVPEQWTEDRL